MRFSVYIKATVLSLLFGLTPGYQYADAAASDGTITYHLQGPPSTFDYSTNKPSSTNWIGLYRASGGGPDDQHHAEDSLAWAYAPNQGGSIRLSTLTLPPGKYKAYFLANDGYKWLVDPIEVVLTHAQGSLSVTSGKSPFTFTYSTASPEAKNWIGIYYAYGGGPDDQERVTGSLVWDWAPDRAGTVQLDVSKLQPGRYKAYFLEDNGFEWMADPVEISLPGNGPLSFIVPNFKTQNARQGTSFKASVRGLLASPYNTKPEFSKTGASTGADWVQVSADGTLSGTPTTSADTAKVTIEASGPNGSKARLEVTIPVFGSGSPLVSELTVMSYNLWFGGTQVNDFHNKQIRFLSNSDVDLVGIQESTDGHAIRLAQALGWDYWQGNDVGIISRYPIVEIYPATSNAGAVRIALGQDKQVILWNAHLGYTPYGPYDFCFSHMDKDEVITREAQSGRTGQMIEIMDRMKEELKHADNTPVLLTGDFNAPSHLDWTESAKDLHCGVGSVLWPTSMYPMMAGLVDSYRVIHRDPVSQPGVTWSPIYYSNNGAPEPKDRLDFIFHRGLQVLDFDTIVIGNPQPEPNHQNNEWTSDHAAVRAIFKVPA